MGARTTRQPSARVLSADLLEGEDLFVNALFGTSARVGRRPAKAVRGIRRNKVQSEGQDQVVSIVLRNSEVQLLDSLVRELRLCGSPQANRSQVIAKALAELGPAQE